MRWLTYWRGRHRLHHGYCPNCNSSPPTRACFVCRGSYAYGSTVLTAFDRAVWRARWDAMRRWA
jgi:hypothetical protein